MFNLVLVAPEIPHNAGAAGRLCLATGSTLHLVKPLGFSLDDKHVRRTGLDYWKDVKVKIWESLDQLLASTPPRRTWFLTTKGTTAHWDRSYQDGDYFICGCETRGLPQSVLTAHRDRLIRIPMHEGSTRSLNLATAAAVVLYEAARQAG
ncbi:MAG: RNA methyltransferase [Verrucomicrobiaceae bacterium]|nr:RNA methyltransferase [Verrucomicrobiaceae bacterium]